MHHSSVSGLLAAAALLFTSATFAAEPPAITAATLIDRAQIENMLVTYYSQLGAGRDDFGAFYMDDGVLDVNGLVAKGKQGIDALYKKTAEGTPARPGTFRMLLSNLKIVVNGNSATADVIWTGINSEKVTAVPQFVEQGREHDELVKHDGKWRFQHRIITSDGGLPAMFVPTYKKR